MDGMLAAAPSLGALIARRSYTTLPKFPCNTGLERVLDKLMWQHVLT